MKPLVQMAYCIAIAPLVLIGTVAFFIWAALEAGWAIAKRWEEDLWRK